MWIEQTDKPFKDHDHNWQAFQDYQRELIEYDPDSALDLVVAVLKVETNPFLLSVLAAGLLEDVIDMPVIDRMNARPLPIRGSSRFSAGCGIRASPTT